MPLSRWLIYIMDGLRVNSLRCWVLVVCSLVLVMLEGGIGGDVATFGNNLFIEANDIYSPCGLSGSPFKNCVSLNPKKVGKKSGTEIRYHSSLLYVADYKTERVVLKRPVRFHGPVVVQSVEGDEGECIKGEYSYENDQGENGDDKYVGPDDSVVADDEEGKIMDYLYNKAKFSSMPKLINPNWENTGWIVMEYFEGISLQEFYQAVYKDIDDIRVQNNHQFQDRMMLKKGVIYKELHDIIMSKLSSGRKQQMSTDKETDGGEPQRRKGTPNEVLDYLELNGDYKRNGWFFNLLISQYNAISHVYLDLLRKGVIHCNPSPSSVMIKKGKLGIHPSEIVFVDYSQSIKWNVGTSQLFYSDIKQSCIPDLRPILAFLLADFGVYIPVSSIDATFFGRISLAPINIISNMDDSVISGRCVDYNNLLKEYYNTHFSCKDLLADYTLKLYHAVGCNTPLPYNAALPYSFRVFHFCQKTCGVCNQECEGLVSLMNTQLYEESFKDERNNVLRDSFVERLFRACRPNTDLLSYEKILSHWVNIDEWGGEPRGDLESGSGDDSGSDNIDRPVLGCKWCVFHWTILKNVLVHYELPQIILYPNIDLFVGNIKILIDSHLTIQNDFRNYLVGMNMDTFAHVLTGSISESEHLGLKKTFVAMYKDAQLRRTVNSYLFVGEDIGRLREKKSGSGSLGLSDMSLRVVGTGEEIPSGLLYYKILEDDYVFINIKIIKQAFVRYMFKGFSSKYRQRIFEMMKTYSLRLLPNSLRLFPIFETQFTS